MALKTLIASMMIVAFGLSASAETKESKASRAPAQAEEDRCLDPDDGSPSGQKWPAFEAAVPACKRALVSLKGGARLDLGEKPLTMKAKNGMTSLRATVVSGHGVYDIDERVHDLKGVILWIAMDRCELREAMLEDAAGRSVERLKDARYIVSRSEITATANGDQLRDFRNACK